MKVWCVTDHSTEQLRASGMVGVSVTVGTTTLKPGGSLDVPSHLVAEIQWAFHQGLLSMTPPPVRQAAVPVVPEVVAPAVLPVTPEVVSDVDEPAALEEEQSFNKGSKDSGRRRR